MGSAHVQCPDQGPVRGTVASWCASWRALTQFKMMVVECSGMEVTTAGHTETLTYTSVFICLIFGKLICIRSQSERFFTLNDVITRQEPLEWAVFCSPIGKRVSKNPSKIQKTLKQLFPLQAVWLLNKSAWCHLKDDEKLPIWQYDSTLYTRKSL